MCIKDTKMNDNVREMIFVRDTPHRKSLVSENDFSGDLGIDANGNLKVWTLGLPDGYLPKLLPYYFTLPYYTKACYVPTGS